MHVIVFFPVNIGHCRPIVSLTAVHFFKNIAVSFSTSLDWVATVMCNALIIEHTENILLKFASKTCL